MVRSDSDRHGTSGGSARSRYALRVVVAFALGLLLASYLAVTWFDVDHDTREAALEQLREARRGLARCADDDSSSEVCRTLDDLRAEVDTEELHHLEGVEGPNGQSVRLEVLYRCEAGGVVFRLSARADPYGVGWGRTYHLGGTGVGDCSGEDFTEFFTSERGSERPSRPDIYGFQFRRANLTRADFRGAHLEDIVFRNSILREAGFRDAKLALTSFEKTEGVGALFQNADVSYVDVEDSDFTDADFRGANLRGAEFRGTTLTGADFSAADLEGASLPERR